MNFDRMRALLLEQAIQGKLVPQLDSEPAVEQIGPIPDVIPFAIPEKWNWLLLKDCVEFSPKISANDDTEVSFIPMADVEPGFQNQCSTKIIKPWTNVKKGFSRFETGDVLLAKITPCFQNRKSCTAQNLKNGIGAGSTEFHVLRCKECLEARYLLWFLKSEYFIHYGVEHFNGTVGQQRVGAPDIKECLIPIPSLEEQTRIVSKLEQAFAEIDRAEKAYQELKSLSEILRKQIIQEAIMGKLVPQLDSEPEIEQIGDVLEDVPFAIPDKWKWVQLSSVGEIVGGGTPKTSVVKYWDDGDINWFTPADLGRLKDLFAYDSERKITQLGLQESSAKLMPANSVLFSSRAPIGHIAISKTQCCTNQGCKSFVPNKKYITTMWAYYVMKQRTPDIVSRASGTTFKEISGKGVGETWIPMPPIEEQRRIVKRLEELLNNVNLFTE